MYRLLIMIPLVSSMLLMAVFAIFSAFHYCNDAKAEKAFMVFLGIFTVMMAVFVGIGIMMCE